jgi:predicted MFS family arabinose efflux permease
MTENVLSLTKTESSLHLKQAQKFIILLGLVSLFSDMVYEGARSIIGPYLALLGAGGAVVGFVAGAGELVGYLLRFVSGYLVERTSKYWLFAFLGYLSNLLCIPLLAFVGYWPAAATLVMLERTGKAIRTPARDAMISYAGRQVGMGKGFGLHQAMDQIGAMLGPLIAAAVLYGHGSYQRIFILLVVPAVITLAILFIANRLYPDPQDLEVHYPELHPESYNRLFWIYLTGSALIAAGYVDFPLIAFHFEKTRMMSSVWIPLSYVLSMGVGAIASLILGRYYDRTRCGVLLWVIPVSALFGPFVFLSHQWFLGLVGMMLWGLGMGAQKSVMKAMVGTLVPKNKRASAYGLFNMVYGVAWFLGSVAMGLLYEVSLAYLVMFSMILQVSSLVFMILVQRKMIEIRYAKNHPFL